MSSTIQLTDFRKKVSKWSTDQLKKKLLLIEEKGTLFQKEEIDIISEFAIKRGLVEDKQKKTSEDKKDIVQSSKETVVIVDKSEEKTVAIEKKKTTKKESKIATEKKPNAPVIDKNNTTKITSLKSDKKKTVDIIVDGVKVSMYKSQYVRYLIEKENMRYPKDIATLVREKFGVNLYYSEYDRCRKQVDEEKNNKSL